MKDFVDDFYSYHFTGIRHNDESSDDSDVEIDLERLMQAKTMIMKKKLTK